MPGDGFHSTQRIGRLLVNRVLWVVCYYLFFVLLENQTYPSFPLCRQGPCIVFSSGRLFLIIHGTGLSLHSENQNRYPVKRGNNEKYWVVETEDPPNGCNLKRYLSHPTRGPSYRKDLLHGKTSGEDTMFKSRNALKSHLLLFPTTTRQTSTVTRKESVVP